MRQVANQIRGTWGGQGGGKGLPFHLQRRHLKDFKLKSISIKSLDNLVCNFFQLEWVCNTLRAPWLEAWEDLGSDFLPPAGEVEACILARDR